MERLTTNKDVSEMGMFELAHNSCYIKNGVAKYRDFEIDMNARDLARKLMVQYGHWKSCEEYGLDSDNELLDNDIFDDTMMDNLMHEPNENIGLIALFYRNLWAMADLRERLKVYEDADEQGLLLRPSVHNEQEVYRINIGAKEPIIQMIVTEICYHSVIVNQPPVFTFTTTDKDRDGQNFYFEHEIGESVFLTREEAEHALKKMEREG